MASESDGVTNRFLKYDLNGHLINSWGSYGTFAGGFWAVHQFSVDEEGNLLGVGRPPP